MAAEIAAKAATVDPAAEDGGGAPAVSELLKPHRETSAVLTQAWNPAVAKCNVAIAALRGYLLPPPAVVLNLFYALGCLLGFNPAELQNVCGDPDWSAIQKVTFFYSTWVLSYLIADFLYLLAWFFTCLFEFS